MPTFVENIASFLPIRALNCFAADPTPLSSPASGSFKAAVLFADISGFTALTERLAQKGSAGVEELTTHLNAYFGQLIELILAHEGDIVKFAGDAMLAIWPAESFSLDQATYCASQCALAILNDLGEYQAADAELRLHIGIGAGELQEFYIGGMSGKWEYVVAGEPISQVALAETAAGIGEVCLSLAAWELIKEHFVGKLLDANVVRLEGFNFLASVADRRFLNVGKSAAVVIYDGMRKRLERYVSLGVLQRLEAGQTDWLGDLRRVSVMFLNLPGMDYGAEAALNFVSETINVIQNTLQVYEGTLNKFLVDDKGSTLVIGFGLPPFSHEDDPLRCVMAGMVLLEKLRGLGLQPKIGITTGICYSGVIGSEQRREYTIIGAVVNLSARLMQAATNGILCDVKTFELTKEKIQFESLIAIKVKGREDAVTVFSPISELRKDLPWWMAEKGVKSIVGREKERSLLKNKLEDLKRGVSGLVVISGEAGIGKSCLIENLLLQAQELGVGSLVGAGDAIAQSKPYHAWNWVFSQLLDLSFLPDLEAKKRQVLDLLEDEPQWLEKAALLNRVLDLDLPDTEVSAGLMGQQRAEATRDILVQLLQDSVNRSPKLLVLEDAHWLDSSSWGLLVAVAQKVNRLLLVVGTRPMGESGPQEYEELLRIKGVEQLHLEALQATDTLDLLCRRLGVKSLPDSVVELIEQKAEGNPFFSEELAYGLREAGVIEIHNDECRIAAGVGNLDELNFPDTVQGVIASRIDRLSPSEQLTLKVASVIGRSFGFRLLRDIHPIEDDKPELPSYLMKLQRFDLTPMETPEPDLGYTFKHIITQEVAYGLMLYSQRRQVHETLALWYERNYEDLSGFYAVLAHHWSQARVAEKAIFYLEKAGEQTVRAHALREALQLFKEALEWVETLPDTVEKKEQELRLQIALGAPLTAVKGYGSPELIKTFTRARELAQELGETANFFPMLWGLFAAHIGQGDTKTAGELAQQLLFLANNSEDSAMRLIAHHSMGANLFYRGDFSEGQYHLERSLFYYDEQKHSSLAFIYGQDSGVANLAILSLCLWMRGYCRQALEKKEESLSLARRIGHPFSLALAYCYEAQIYEYLQNLPKTKKYGEMTISFCLENEFSFWGTVTSIVVGSVNQQLGEIDLGLTQMQQNLTAYLSQGPRLGQIYYMKLTAMGYLNAGLVEECISLIDKGLELADLTAAFWKAELYRIKGDALIMQSKDAEGEICFQKAFEVARSQGAVSLERRAIISLSGLLYRQGKTEAARQCMTQLDLNAEEFDPVDHEKGMTLLAAIG